MEFIDVNSGLLLGPFVLCCLGIAGVVWFAMLGWSLKTSLGMFVENEPGYLLCLLIAFLIIITNLLVFAGFYITLGPQPWYIVACYQAMIQVILLVLLSRCNPFQALFTTLAHYFLSSFGTIVIALALMLTCGSAISGFKERMNNRAARQPDTATSNPFAGNHRAAQ